MIENRTRHSLQSGKVVFGCFVRYRDASFAELVAMQGWDFLVFDSEHGSLEPHHLEDLCRAADVRGVTPMVRVPANERHLIGRALDTGCHGVHVPSVESAQQAASAVGASRFRPFGIRGLAATRAADWGMTESLLEFTSRANEQTLVVIQIETLQAIANIEDVVGTDGVDVIFLGPTDLTQSLGLMGASMDAEVHRAMMQVADAVVGSDKCLGVWAADVQTATEWIELGARYIATGVEGFIRRGMGEYFEAVRDSGS